MSLQLANIGKSFGSIEVLKDINIEIDKGDFLVLLGGSGCGKSTLLNCIAGLVDVTTGTICIHDRDVTAIDPSKRNVAMVFQSYALYPTMTVARNIGFALECAGISKTDIADSVIRVATLLQIKPLLKRKPSQLSGGQRQRVAIGRALVRDPDLFLLDEPMSNLDANLRNEMRFELRELHRRLGSTFVLVTHDQVEAMSMATKVVVLDKGVVQQLGTPYDIYYFPQNMFVATFIGTVRMNLIRSNIETIDNTPHVRIGDRLACLKNYVFADAVPTDGTPIIFGIRPENIYRSYQRLEGPDFLEGDYEVTRSELTGGDVQVWFDLGQGETLRTRFRSTRTPDIGTSTKLYLDLKNISLFDAKTELRL